MFNDPPEIQETNLGEKKGGIAIKVPPSLSRQGVYARDRGGLFEKLPHCGREDVPGDLKPLGSTMYWPVIAYCVWPIVFFQVRQSLRSFFTRGLFGWGACGLVFFDRPSECAKRLK